jgi:hypothetical protein
MDAYRNREMGVVLKHLLSRWESGGLKGLALCARPVTGSEEISFTGVYREDHAHALSAAMKMSRRINEMQDDENE